MSPEHKKIKIYKPDFFGKKYGGNLYDSQIIELLSNEFEFEWVNAKVSNSKFLTFFSFLKLLVITKFRRNQIIFLNFLSLPFFPFFNKRNIVLIHHIDWSNSPFFSQLYQRLCFGIFCKLKNKWETVVVVSQFWKEKLESMGFKNIKIVYNSIENNEADEMLSEEAFKKKYYLPKNKKYIYLGNAQKGKGWTEAYPILKDLDLFFIITGVSNNITVLPEKIYYLYLPPSDYAALLKYAECTILLSRFSEGWNRVAHESMLQKTPVIGSGTGGMKELLEKGHQIICKDLKNLPEITNFALQNHEQIGNEGFKSIVS